MEKLTVIVVHHADARLLERCLTSLEAQSLGSFCTIVVANGCDDESLALARRPSSLNLQVVRLDRNSGFAGGANAGIRASRSPLVALLNDDAEADPKWLDALVSATDSQPSVSSFASRIVDARGRIDSAGDVLTAFGELANRGRGEPDGAAFEIDREVFGACAGAALYRRALFDRIGLFDEQYFHTSEDADLSFRARLAGERCLYVSAARVRHEGGVTRRLDPGRSVALGSRNVELAFWSNLPGTLLLRSLPWHVARGLWGLATRAGTSEAVPYLRGKWDALLEFPRLLELRRERLGRPTHSLDGWVEPGLHFARARGAIRKRLPSPVDIPRVPE